MAQTRSRARDRTATVTTARARRSMDLRHAIAALFAVYGCVLVALGVQGPSPTDLHKTGGWNVNLWCGVAMLAFTALCAGWAYWRPVGSALGGETAPPAAADDSQNPHSTQEH